MPSSSHPREVDSHGNCSKCGGSHYGSLMCPITLSDEQILANRKNQQSSLPSKPGICERCGYNVLACTCEPTETNTCKGASEGNPGEAPTSERPEAVAVASGRARQTRKVMLLIGSLLDAWEGLPNDVASLDELKQVRRYIQRINSAMEDA